jgi:hypothetical protein
MSKYVIVKRMSLMSVDGVNKRLNLSSVPSNVDTLYWDTISSTGAIDFLGDVFDDVVPNRKITVAPSYLAALVTAYASAPAY